MKTIFDIQLTYLEEKILKKLTNLIEKEILEAEQLLIFGSRTKGKSNENSDLDIAIIINADIEQKIWKRLWDVKWRTLESLQSEEFPLSLIPIKKEDFISSNYGLENIVKKEGVLWWKRKN
jgi:predicted nucleotidyltransferase